MRKQYLTWMMGNGNIAVVNITEDRARIILMEHRAYEDKPATTENIRILHPYLGDFPILEEIALVDQEIARIEEHKSFYAKKQNQRDKEELQLQLRLIAAGALGSECDDDDDILLLYGHDVTVRFKNGVRSAFRLYGENKPENMTESISINSITDYLFSQGIRAIKE